MQGPPSSNSSNRLETQPSQPQEALRNDESKSAANMTRLNWGPPWIGPIHHRAAIDLLWLMIVIFPLGAGVVFFGWRGLLGVCTTGLSTLATFTLVRVVVRKIRPSGSFDPSLHILVLGLLLGMTLPVTCNPEIPAVAGLVLGLIAHMVGRSHTIRVHPVAVALLLTYLLAGTLDLGRVEQGLGAIHAPHKVLRIERVVIGDVCDGTGENDLQPWLSTRPRTTSDAISRIEPGAYFHANQVEFLQDRSSLAQSLATGRLIPMTELLLGAVPGPIGGSSRALLLVVGLYMMYRRLAWWPMAMAAFIASLVTLLVMPLPGQGHLTIVASRLLDMGWMVSITYFGYMILGSQLGLIVLILAPQTAPTSDNGRLIYGALIGSVTIVAQWYFATPMAGYLSLAVAGLFSRPLDALRKSLFAVH